MTDGLREVAGVNTPEQAGLGVSDAEIKSKQISLRHFP
jgi:hypothetical protein